MKSAALAFVCWIGAWTTWAGNPSTSTNDLLPRYHAIVIGINKYEPHGGNGWSDLRTARPDAEALADTLERDYGFEVTRLLDGQATLFAIMKAMDQIVNYSPQDAVLIYFAGHGQYDSTLGEGFWIPSDARQNADGYPVRQDWLWNAVLTKTIGASEARHILVIADACFGGSLFRGEKPSKPSGEVGWYVRALARPSRFLISSGDLEPVHDEGARHSVFAQMLLNYFQYQDKGYFSASELGLAVRDKVCEMTGQMALMGPLSVASHAGGEFVFVKKQSDFPELARAWQADAPDAGASDAPVCAQETTDHRQRLRSLRDIAMLDQRGASNTVKTLVRRVLASGANDALTQAVVGYVTDERKQQRWNETQELLKQVREWKDRNLTPSATNTAAVRPRVLAILEPVAVGAGADQEAQALLYEIALWSALKAQDRLKIVEREVLQDVMRELEISSSNLSDAPSRLVLGQLFPAGTLLFLKIVSTRDGDKIMARLVDTQTSEVLVILSETVGPDASIDAVCGTLADRIVAELIKRKPLMAQVTEVQGDTVKAKIGRFQLAKAGMRFGVYSRQGSVQREVGTARLMELGDEESGFVVSWLAGRVSSPSLWLSEAP